jgi:hypothetical protein
VASCVDPGELLAAGGFLKCFDAHSGDDCRVPAIMSRGRCPMRGISAKASKAAILSMLVQSRNVAERGAVCTRFGSTRRLPNVLI